MPYVLPHTEQENGLSISDISVRLAACAWLDPGFLCQHWNPCSSPGMLVSVLFVQGQGLATGILVATYIYSALVGKD